MGPDMYMCFCTFFPSLPLFHSQFHTLLNAYIFHFYYRTLPEVFVFLHRVAKTCHLCLKMTLGD